jgi:hypothetical protein
MPETSAVAPFYVVLEGRDVGIWTHWYVLLLLLSFLGFLISCAFDRPTVLRQTQGIRRAIWFRLESLQAAIAEVELAYAENRVKIKST